MTTPTPQYFGIEAAIKHEGKVVGKFTKYHGQGPPARPMYPGDLYFDIEGKRAIYVCMWGSWRLWLESMEPVVHPSVPFMDRFLWVSSTDGIGWYTAKYITIDRTLGGSMSQPRSYAQVIKKEIEDLHSHQEQGDKAPSTNQNIPPIMRKRANKKQGRPAKTKAVTKKSTGTNVSINQTFQTMPATPSAHLSSITNTTAAAGVNQHAIDFQFRSSQPTEVVFQIQDYNCHPPSSSLPQPEPNRNQLTQLGHPPTESFVQHFQACISALVQENTKLKQESIIAKQEFRNLEIAHAKSETLLSLLTTRLDELKGKEKKDQSVSCPDAGEPIGSDPHESPENFQKKILGKRKEQLEENASGVSIFEGIKLLQEENKSLREQNQTLLATIQESSLVKPSLLLGPSSTDLEKANAVVQLRNDKLALDIEAGRRYLANTEHELFSLRESVKKVGAV